MSKLIIDFEDKFDFEEFMAWLEDYKEKASDSGIITGLEIANSLIPAYISKE